MVSRGVFYFVTAALFLVGLCLIAYQHINFEVPFIPGQERQLWTVEAKIEFDAQLNEPVTVAFALPAVQPGYSQVKQSTSSLGYGVNYVDRLGAKYVEWTRRSASGAQLLFYRSEFLADPEFNGSSMKVPPLRQSVEPEPYATAIREIAEDAYSHSADPFSLTVQVIRALTVENESNSLLKAQYRPTELVVKILESAGVQAREVGVLTLEDGRRNRSLTERVAVFSGSKYQIFDPLSGVSGMRSNELIWTDSGASVLDVAGGRNARVSFSMLKNGVPSTQAGNLRAEINRAAGAELLSFSINSLPIEEQSLFKNILLLPVGVLIVVFLRIIVGIKTSGTFMPVLIAMAFLQTSLTVGLIGFVAIVGAGLVVRSWLSHLNLLLVARISAVIIVVICIIGSVSLFTYKAGLTEGLKVTFFPMIILSWTIERMSILWEEEGYKEVFKQGGGSLFVALCAYLAMDSAFIQNLTFNFLGLQLVLLSLVLVMGNYTGFRLSELKRFKPLAAQIKSYRNGDEKESEHHRLKRELRELKADPHNTLHRWLHKAPYDGSTRADTDTAQEPPSDSAAPAAAAETENSAGKEH